MASTLKVSAKKSQAAVQPAKPVELRARVTAPDVWLPENGENFRRLLVTTGGQFRDPVHDLFGWEAIAGLDGPWAQSEKWKVIKTRSKRPRRALRLLYELAGPLLAAGRLEVQVRPSGGGGWVPLAAVVSSRLISVRM